ncbi:SDR family NAD(P)-dependent oxidoreductase [Pleomorphomonas sp. JP5]|uniref:SDR family NAD(P)-dependent oxidoreductase n=1 Tax=Pleomorphomonas sp. JP5 TaxID=2942998 RepID=UPI00204496F8|nr:SDR family oxidoreductase [Pleomorphomonas sp. JP5]MCM5557563.1 SDR family oxidoreductase [Pleomorphomonas sp. JP5]
MGLLDGRVALVTGGESGIGAATAKALGAEGAAVAVLFHTDDKAASAVRDAIVDEGGKAMIVKADVGDEALVTRAFATVTAELGLPDLLINSAGLNMSGVPVADMELSQWNRLIRTDLTGAFLTSRAFVRGLREARRPGRIVNISSIHSTAVRYGGADYCAAKAGLDSLTRTMAVECGPMRIGVNAIAPGMILTPMNREAQSDPRVLAAARDHIPWGRAGKAEEVAALAVYLCSDKASYMTGAVVTIDGGLMLEQALGA